MVTGGCFWNHEARRRYSYDLAGDLPEARRVHDCGLFVGNLPRDLSAEIDVLEATLAEVA